MNVFDLILDPTIHFARKGEAIVGGATITELVHPNADDPAWKDFGCLDELNIISETQADTPTKKWIGSTLLIEGDEYVTVNGFSWRTDKMNDLKLELDLGLNGPVVKGQPMAAFGKAVRRIEGWIKVEGVNRYDHSEFLVMNMFVRLTSPVEGNGAKDAKVRPQFRALLTGTLQPVVRIGAPAE